MRLLSTRCKAGTCLGVVGLSCAAGNLEFCHGILIRRWPSVWPWLRDPRAARRPGTAGPACRGHILAAGLDHDHQILAAARQVLAAAGPTAIGPGSIAAESTSQINKDGGTGFVGGQHVHHHGASTQAPAADWVLVHIRDSVFELRNVGSGTAQDVLLDAPGAVRFDPPGDLSAWGPGSGREFFAVGSMQTGHPRLVVRWKNAVSEPTHQSWERPLPG